MIKPLKYLFVCVIILLMIPSVNSQTEEPDTTSSKQEDKIKEGLNFGALPIIGYNTDIGFQYGIIVNMFNYGDGTKYPEYKYSIYAELSRTTKGGGINQLFFDSKHLLPNNLRLTADLSYLTEKALNFYGFNGYEAVYNKNYEDDNNSEYKSRVFYRHERKFTRFTIDLKGKLNRNKLLWYAGIGFYHTENATVDIDRLNKGKDEEDKLPDTTLLYDEYVEWGIIRDNEKNGGNTPHLKFGIIYDSRDNEPNPKKGIWTELIFFWSPILLTDQSFSYLKMAITHRQYFTLIKDRLSFAYRLSYQGTLAGSVPFYMQPIMINSHPKFTTIDGLGGSTTLRGVLRNRIVGEGIAYGNIELRWKFLKTLWFNQNFYFAVNAFSDVGRVVQDISIYGIDTPEWPVHKIDHDQFDPGAESFHWTTGLGLFIAMNQNFIISANYGKALDNRDGDSGFYITIGLLF